MRRLPGRGVSVLHPPPLPAPLYKGSTNAWECDEGGHLNVRFHCERALTGLHMLAAALDMPRAFAPVTSGTLLPLDLHVRYLKEALPGEMLVMSGGVLTMQDSEALVCLDARHADGAPGAAFTLRFAHVDPHSLTPFAFSKRTREAAARLHCQAPEHALPRSIDPSAPTGEISVARADALSVLRSGGSSVTPDQCDAFGRLRAEHMFGRASDAVPALLGPWREKLREAAAEDGQDVAPAGAVLEARVAFRRWPQAGDLIEVRSAVVEALPKAIRIRHWMLDPVSGAAWASMEAIALTFDARTRKAIQATPAMKKALSKTLKPEMNF